MGCVKDCCLILEMNMAVSNDNSASSDNKWEIVINLNEPDNPFEVDVSTRDKCEAESEAGPHLMK